LQPPVVNVTSRSRLWSLSPRGCHEFGEVVLLPRGDAGGADGALMEWWASGDRSWPLLAPTAHIMRVATWRTGVQSMLLNCGHGSQVWDADFPPAGEIVLLDAYPQTSAGVGLFVLVAILSHGQGKGLLGIERLATRAGRQLLPRGKQLVFPLGLMHSPDKGLLVLRRRGSA